MTGSGGGEEGAELTSSIFLGLMFCDRCFVVLEEERVERGSWVLGLLRLRSRGVVDRWAVCS